MALAMADSKNMDNKRLKIALVTVAALAVQPLIASQVFAQESARNQDIELVEEKASRQGNDADTSNLLTAESSEKLKKAMKDGAYLSFKLPKDNGFQLNMAQRDFAVDQLTRFSDASDVLGRPSANPTLAGREGGVDLILARGSNAAPLTNGFSLQLSSALQYNKSTGAIDVPSFQPDTAWNSVLEGAGLIERKYNVGLALGYEGVMLDAKYAEKDDNTLENYKGLNLGLGYRSNNWMTRLGVSEYSFERTDATLLPEGVRQLYQIELGGIYRLTSRMSLSAGVKVTDYGRFQTEEESTWGSAFYLGGRFSY